MRERSRAYPGVSLEECAENIRLIKKGLGGGKHDRSTISKALGVAEPTATRPIAALVHFGLLERQGKNYSTTELAKMITDPLENEFRIALQQCMKEPVLYQELLEKFEPEGRIPGQLATILHRQFGITDKASKLAGAVFVESAQFAGIVDQDMRFLKSEENASTSEDEQGEKRSVAMVTKSDITTTLATKSSDPPASLPEQRFRFRLSEGKFAEITCPADLTMNDIAIMRKQLELLELQAGDE